MKKLILVLSFVFFTALPAGAQTPTVVTGTITDPSGLPYSFASVSAQLIPTTASPTIIVNGVPVQIGGQQNANADANGTFSMNLFCNSAGGGCSVISPSGTQWQITVNTNGVGLPLGTGPQACSATVTITGLSQSISANLSACPRLSKTGATVPGALNPASSPYNAKFDARWKADGALTSGQPTVTSATIAFTQSDVGKKIYTVNSANGLTRLNGTILSVQSATSATASVNATATESSSAIVVCTDDTAALVSAWTDALNQNKLLVLPSGATCVTAPLFQALGPSFSKGTNFSVQGSGPGTVLIVTPDFSFGTCNTNGFGGCLWGVSAQSFAFPDGLRPWPQVGNFTVTGLGSIYSGAASGINLFTSGAGVIWHDIVISDFCSATAASSMFSMATEDRAYNLNIQGVNCPNTNNQMPPISVTGSSVDIYSPIIAYLAQRAIAITNTSDVTVHGGLFTQTALNTGSNPHTAVGIVNSTNIRFIGTTVSNGTSSVNGWDVDPTSNVVFDGIHCADTAAASSACLNVQAGGIAKIGRYSQLISSAGAVPITNAGTIFDDGTNSYGTGTSTGVAPTCAMTTGGGTGPACALVAGSTNEKGTVRMTPGTTPGATGTVTLTFAGTFAGATGTTPSCTFNYANTGTGAWSLTTTTPIVMTTRSTTVPVFNWNQTGALTAASTYDIDYVCVPR